jgi:hypothetical protein
VNEIARFEIEKDKDRQKLLKVFGSNGYPVAIIQLEENGLWIGQRVVVYEKEGDK